MKKPAVKVAVRSLGLGLATSIAIAWGAALWNPECRWTCTGVARPQLCGVVRMDGPGLTIHALFRRLDNDPLVCKPPVGRFTSFTFLGGVSWAGFPAEHNGFLLNGGDRDAPGDLLLSARMPDDCDMIAVQAAGWPLRCLSATAVLDVKGTWLMSGALPVRNDRFGGTSLFARSLPVIPLAGGLALNVLIFGGAWFALFMGPALLRPVLVRRRRRRRWRCRCGYDLHGAAGPVCPECGRAIPKRFHR